MVHETIIFQQHYKAAVFDFFVVVLLFFFCSWQDYKTFMFVYLFVATCSVCIAKVCVCVHFIVEGRGGLERKIKFNGEALDRWSFVNGIFVLVSFLVGLVVCHAMEVCIRHSKGDLILHSCLFFVVFFSLFYLSFVLV